MILNMKELFNDYLEKTYEKSDILEKNTLESIYNFIIMNSQKEEIILFLFAEYLHKENSDKLILKYATDFDKMKRISMFTNSKHHAFLILESYLKDYLKVNQKTDTFLFIDEYLKQNLANLINILASFNYSKENIVMILSLSFSAKNFLCSDEKVRKIIFLLRRYWPFLIRVIYADIYASSLNLNKDLRCTNPIINYVENKVLQNDFTFPQNEKLSASILSYYYDLIVSKKDDVKDISSKNMQVLRRINPFYKLKEESD